MGEELSPGLARRDVFGARESESLRLWGVGKLTVPEAPYTGLQSWNFHLGHCNEEAHSIRNFQVATIVGKLTTSENMCADNLARGVQERYTDFTHLCQGIRDRISSTWIAGGPAKAQLGSCWLPTCPCCPTPSAPGHIPITPCTPPPIPLPSFFFCSPLYHLLSLGLSLLHRLYFHLPLLLQRQHAPPSLTQSLQ